MPKYLKITLDGEELDVDANAGFPITIDYQLEDIQDFQKKKSSEIIGLKIPATLNNQKVLNTFNNTAVDDSTAKKYYRNIRNIVAESNGVEVFIGKAIPKKASKRNGVPTSFELNCFGNNGDWIIDLKEVTFYELLKHITFKYTKQIVESSWNFDGTNENLPYVFAPVKYGDWLDPDASNNASYSIQNMKPSLSIYWILYWGFKKAGYRIESDFFNTSYFRKMVMPWTFGAFLSSEGTKYNIHQFFAKSTQEFRFGNRDFDYQIVNLNVLDNADNGCFDNNNTVADGDYFGNTKHGGGDYMSWKYNTPHYGPLQVFFVLNLFSDYKMDQSSTVGLDVYWYKKDASNNTVYEIQKNHIFDHEAPVFGSAEGAENTNVLLTSIVNPNDEIYCSVKISMEPSDTYTVCRIILRVDEFKIDYFKVPIGGDINFDSYLAFKKNNFLDLVKGVCDTFNLSIQSDPVNKTVLIEPTHDYSLTDNLALKNGGYFKSNVLDFSQKEDISEESSIELYDDNARELVFKFKDDTADGILKVVQDRYQITLGSSRYVFSERFKAEKKEFENRYFAPTMHFLVESFSTITSIAPQMICLVPENISNTSSKEAQNVMLPKIAHYKGLIVGVGGWVFDGQIKTNYPYLFSVNYKDGGENDPILSYSDEKIGTNQIGKGLLKRFFWQRLAIMNNGQWLNTHFVLNNKDITNWYHRERIDLNGELWELLIIKGFTSISDKSTKCTLRKWYPVTKKDFDNTFPSETSVLSNILIQNSNANDKNFDIQYNRLICLATDIPTP
jgi:hypothetical protein